MTRRFRLLLILALSWLVTVELGAQSTQYIYDELGRLVAVIAPSGDAAAYSYDAVGNLLSITRYTAATVSIVEFTPNGSPTGANVTIYGTGFSATPSQNTVTFNGVTATVVSSTTTTIVATVPGTATTGTIGVTSPNGSAVSAASFVILTAAGLPSITTFSPTVGAEGTSVTISGTNFDSTLTNNRVALNLTGSWPSTGSTTSLQVAVPTGGGSGKFSVSTPVGTAVSSADFFVPPAPFVAADVLVTDRMAIGDTRAVAIGTSGKIGLVVFDGTLGQRISLKVVPGPLSTVTMYRPNLRSMSTAGIGVTTALLEPPLLEQTGTYSILVDPTASATGTTTLTLYNVPADISGTITAGGSAVTVTTTVPGQNGSLTFTGTAGHRMALNVGAGPLGTVSLRQPDGTALASASSGAVSAFIEPTTLATSGTHSAFVDYLQANTGSVALTLYDVPADVTGTVTVNGSATPVTITTAGQNANLTFSGTSGQQVTVRLTGNTISTTTVKLLKPDGSQLTSFTSLLGSFNLAQQTLPVTGTYTVVVDPSKANTGSINVAVTNP